VYSRGQETLLTVPHEIPDAFLCVELNGEASNISHGVSASSRTRYGGETQENGCLSRCVRKESCFGELGNGGVKLEGTVGGGTSSMD
jgi:hypothetical protein